MTTTAKTEPCLADVFAEARHWRKTELDAQAKRDGARRVEAKAMAEKGADQWLQNVAPKLAAASPYTATAALVSPTSFEWAVALEWPDGLTIRWKRDAVYLARPCTCEASTPDFVYLPLASSPAPSAIERHRMRVLLEIEEAMESPVICRHPVPGSPELPDPPLRRLQPYQAALLDAIEGYLDETGR